MAIQSTEMAFLTRDITWFHSLRAFQILIQIGKSHRKNHITQP